MMPELQEDLVKRLGRPILCHICSEPIAMFWQNQYWCKHCGEYAELIDLITILIAEIKLKNEVYSKTGMAEDFNHHLQNLYTVVEEFRADQRWGELGKHILALETSVKKLEMKR